ncbi:MAG: BolA family protein [Caulobacteraceae bacterium]
MASLAGRMEEKLRQALAPERLEIIDDSSRHAGHAGAREGSESHFDIRIVSAAFAGKSRIERQRLVHRLLAEEIAGGVHALALTTLAPGEA